MKKIVLTGGPSSGKTTALAILKEEFGTDIAIVPEAATMLYSGGYPRTDNSPRHIYHAQRVIFALTQELENLVTETNPQAKLIVCDRGSIDGAVYWPYGVEAFFKEFNTTPQAEFAKYYAVIHMCPPQEEKFYQKASYRTEDLQKALEVDEAILKLWGPHPRHFVPGDRNDYVKKALAVRDLINKIMNGEL